MYSTVFKVVTSEAIICFESKCYISLSNIFDVYIKLHKVRY